MPYSLSEPDNLPSNVQKLSDALKKQWISIFNQAVTDGKEESAAFSLANGIIKKEGKAVDLSMSFEEIRQQLCVALREQFGMADSSPYIAATYFNHVIAEMEYNEGPIYYRVPYVVIESNVTFADKVNWLKVERRTEWVEKKTTDFMAEIKAGARHSSTDMSMLQQMHDSSKMMHDVATGLGATCNCGKAEQPKEEPAGEKPDNADSKTIYEKAIAKGNPLQIVDEDEDTITVANFLALYEGKDLEGLGSKRVNADGSIGEYFSKATDFNSTYTDIGMLYVDWEHGRDDLNKDEVLGYVDWKSAEDLERGKWVKRILNRRNKYVQWLKTLVEAGLIGTSSEPVQSRVQKSTDGHITRWPLMRDSLTVNPMDYRMLDDKTLEALKALGDIPCVKNACLKYGLLGTCKTVEIEIKAKLAYINSVLED